MSANPFAELPASPASHFTLHFYAAVSSLVASASDRRGGGRSIWERFPFLEGYQQQLARKEVARLDRREAAGWWREAIGQWEDAYPGFLPIRAIRTAASLDHNAVTLLFAAGLVEEDARFGLLFEALDCLQSRRPTVGVLAEVWDASDAGDARALASQLRRLGLLHVANPDAPRAEWALQVPTAVWDAVRGERSHHPVNWARYQPPAALPELQDLIVADALRAPLGAIPALLRSGESRALVLRGPRHNGRRTVLGAVARALGRGVLEISGLSKPDDDRWLCAGVLAIAYDAVPVIAFELAPGETMDVPALGVYDGPIGVVLGRQGGLAGPGVERALTFTLDIPEPANRREHWRRGVSAVDDLDKIGDRFRLTSGNIRRAAALARSHAILAGRQGITADDVQEASRSLNREALDALAVRLPVAGDWRHLAAREDTLRELMELELRCRHRERLGGWSQAVAGLASNCGVRALFRGPSGTGKTLAARLLASALEADLYRLDLSTLVNKYIGETEKNLDRALSRAEELGVILLLDEGDALLTQRTSVQSSNDRYANLETNYLLQRLESFEGILLVTTNAGDRIDSAFERRMDVVIDFRPPDAAERWDIWHLHLPAAHRVDPDVLNDVASRCVLSGGQIRNAALHASLLAIDSDGPLTTAHLEAAVRREYRKAGGVCPLRRAEPAWVARG
jgi:hypothetical protein